MELDPLERLKSEIADRYRIERLIGEGGSATVYLAHDLKLGRLVAVKVLRPEITAEIAAERFALEIRVAARLQHPNVLSVIDAGAAGGLLYYTIPYIRGESLRDLLRRTPQLDLVEAVRLAREIADALQYAHRQGVIHRDIKPENILISEGHAMIADFGLAKAVAAVSASGAAGEGGGVDHLTASGLAMGTPWYLSPEQAAGAEDVDGRTDEYALACVFYEMVAGEPPFPGHSPRTVAARHMHQPPPSLSIARPAVSRAMAVAVEKALAKVPADRFAGPGEFAAALARDQASGDRVRVHFRATRSLIVAAVTASAVWLSWRLVRVPGDAPLDPSHIAVMSLVAPGGSSDTKAFAATLMSRLTDGLSLIDGLSVLSRLAVTPYEAAGVSLDSVARALRVGTLIGGTVESVGGRMRVSVQLIDGASGRQLATTYVDAAKQERYLLVDATADTVIQLLRRELGKSIQKRQRLVEAGNQEAFDLVQAAGERLDQFRTQLRDGSVEAMHRSLANADSQLAEAERRDPRWIEPVILRGRLADERLMRASVEHTPVGQVLAEGLAHAQRALQMAPRNPRALQLRGLLLYRKWSLVPPPDSDDRAALRDSAEADLRGAVDGNADRVTALQTLSELVWDDGRPEEAMVLAQQAHDIDPYFDMAYRTVLRLFEYNLGAGRDSAAAHWCLDGARRFGAEPVFYDCQLQLMAWTGVVHPDPARARVLKARAEALYPASGRADYAPRAELLVGVVDARAGYADSARAILRRRMGNGPPNASTVVPAADILILLDEREAGITLLVQFAREYPDRRSGVLRSAGMRMVRDDPRVVAAYGLVR